MDLSYITFLLFAAFSSLRMFSYLPQIYSVATDKNGASAISYSTWGSGSAPMRQLPCTRSTTSRTSMYLASVSVVYAACCLSVIILTIVKPRRPHCLGATVSEEAVLRPARWLEPRWGIAAAAIVVISAGLGARWVLEDVSRLISPSATAERSAEIAVADTPFEDEQLAASAKTAGHSPLPLPRSEKRAPCRRPESSSRARPPRRARRSRRGSISRLEGASRSNLMAAAHQEVAGVPVSCPE